MQVTKEEYRALRSVVRRAMWLLDTGHLTDSEYHAILVAAKLLSIDVHQTPIEDMPCIH